MSTNTKSIDLESSSTQSLSRTDSNLSSGFPGKNSGGHTGDFSFECWVKLESAPASGGKYAIISKFGDPSTSNQSYEFSYRDDSGTKNLRLFFRDSNADLTNVQANVTLTAGTWYHIAVSSQILIGEGPSRLP